MAELPRIEHLYLHVPFCARVCPYCSFHVHRGSGEEIRRFAAALATELRLARGRYDLSLRTIYFGGGTPSLLSPELLAQVVAEIPRPGLDEFTIEANPRTVTPALAEAWARAGVTRVSLDAQSFDAEYLRLLGRQHTPEDIPATVDVLRAAGLGNINIDLMFALPSQPEALWRATLSAAIACRPDHVSAYALTYEEDTPFLARLQRGDFQQDEEREAAMFTTTVAMLTAAGLPPYEISNFARAGFESHHNRAYWAGRDYLGVGPSAVSTVRGTRWKNVADTAAYVREVETGHLDALRTNIETLDATTLRNERIMLGLRTREGIGMELLPHAEKAVAQLLEEGLAEQVDNRLRLTPRGRLLADGIAGMLMG